MVEIEDSNCGVAGTVGVTVDGKVVADDVTVAVGAGPVNAVSIVDPEAFNGSDVLAAAAGLDPTDG